MHVQNCCFVNLNLTYCFSVVLVAVPVVVAKAPSHCKLYDVSGQQNSFTCDIFRVLVLILDLIKTKFYL